MASDFDAHLKVELKVVVVGDLAVGKTMLVRREDWENFDPDHELGFGGA